MHNKLLLTTILACATFVQSSIDLLLPKTIQLTFISQQEKTNPNEVTPEFLYCVEVLQNIAHIQEKRPLTLEEIIITMKVLVYLHTHNSPYQQGAVVVLDDKTIGLPFSKQLFTEIFQQNSDSDDE